MSAVVTEGAFVWRQTVDLSECAQVKCVKVCGLYIIVRHPQLVHILSLRNYL